MIERLSLWGLTPGENRPDISLPGSPERSVARAAVEDAEGRVWVVERLHPGQMDRRERIGRALNVLSDAGVPVPPYRPTSGSGYVAEADGYHWQLAPFVPGDPLPQPDFIDEPERGDSLGRFVSRLSRGSVSIREFDTQPPFLLEDYVNELMAAIAPRRPEVHEALLPVLPVLVPLFEAWNDLPVGLCQGDFHPLNVIWQGRDVAAVIDWEFMGMRPRLFDVANCLGCVGIEEPQGLVRGLAASLLRTLRDEDVLDDFSLSVLPELVLAMRFAWMSEWLRKHDREMADLEIRYMRLLANSLDTLAPAWKHVLER